MHKFYKIFFSLFFLFTVPCLSNDSVAPQTQTLQLNNIRERFSKAVKSEDLCTALYEEMQNTKENQEAVYDGYFGVVTISMAKYTFNPFTKLSYFERGRKLVEAAIKKEPANVELRFLRFTVQEHVPYFLAYSSDIEADKKLMLDSLKQLQMPKLKEAIITYILNSKSFTDAEKQRVITYR